MNARYDGDVFTDAVQYDMLIHPGSATQSILLGVQSGAASALAIHENDVRLHADVTEVDGLLKLTSNVRMVGGFRIDNGLSVTGGNTSVGGGAFSVSNVALTDGLFVVNDDHVVARRDAVVESNLTVRSNLNVAGDVNIAGQITSPAFDVGGDVFIGGDLHVDSNLYVSTDALVVLDDASSNLIRLGRDVIADSNLHVAGDAAFSGGSFRVSDASSNALFSVGTSQIKTHTDVYDFCNLTVYGTALLSNASAVRGGLDVTGSSAGSNALTVHGASVLRGPFTVHPNPGSLTSSDAFLVDDAVVKTYRSTDMACNLTVGDSVVVHGADIAMTSGAFTASSSNVEAGRNVIARCNVDVTGRADVQGAFSVGTSNAGGSNYLYEVSAAKGAVTQVNATMACNLTVAGDVRLGSSNSNGQTTVALVGDTRLTDGAGLTLSGGGDVRLDGGALYVSPYDGGGVSNLAFAVTDAEIEGLRDAHFRSNVYVKDGLTLTAGSSGARIDDGGLTISRGALRTERGSFTVDDTTGVSAYRDLTAYSNVFVDGAGVQISGGDLIVLPGAGGSNRAFGVTDAKVKAYKDFEVDGGTVHTRIASTHTDIDGIFVVNPSTLSGNEAFFVNGSDVAVRRPLSVASQATFEDVFEVYPGGSASSNGSLGLGVYPGKIRLDRDVDVSSNLSVVRGDVDVKGGDLHVEPYPYGSGDALRVTDAAVTTLRPLHAERDVTAYRDLETQGVLRVVQPSPSGGGGGQQVMWVSPSNMVTKVDTRLVGKMDVVGDADVRNGSFRVFPASSSYSTTTSASNAVAAFTVTDTSVDIHDDDVRLRGSNVSVTTGTTFDVVNGGGAGGSNTTAVHVDASEVRVDRDLRATCNVAVSGDVSITGPGAALSVGGKMSARGDLTVDSNLEVLGVSALRSNVSVFDGTLSVHRRGANSNAIVTRFTDALATINTPTVFNGPVDVWPAGQTTATTTQTRAFRVNDCNVEISRSVVLYDDTDVRSTFRVVDSNSGDDVLLTSSNDVRAGRDVVFSCNLAVRGDVGAAGAATVLGTLDVYGDSSGTSNNSNAPAALSVASNGDTHLGAGLTVASNAVVKGALTADSNVTLRGGDLLVVDKYAGTIARFSNAGISLNSKTTVNADGVVTGSFHAGTASTAGSGGGLALDPTSFTVRRPTSLIGSATVTGDQFAVFPSASSSLSTGAPAFRVVTDSNVRAYRDFTAECNMYVGLDVDARGSGYFAGGKLVVGEDRANASNLSTSAALWVDGNKPVVVNRDLHVANGGRFVLDGAATLSNVLDVRGRADFAAGFVSRGDAVVRGSTRLNGPFRVDVDAAEAFAVSDSNIVTYRDTVVDSNLFVGGRTSLHGPTKLLSDVEVWPSGDSTASAPTLRVTPKGVSVAADLKVDSNAVVKEDLHVLRDAEVACNVNVGGPLSVGRELDVSGPAVLRGDVSAYGSSLRVAPGGNVEVFKVDASNIDVTRPLGVLGNTTVTGKFRVFDQAAPSNAAPSLAVYDNGVDVDRDLNVSGVVGVSENVNVSNDVLVGNSLRVVREAVFDSNLHVLANARVGRDLDVGGRGRVADGFEAQISGRSALRVGPSATYSNVDVEILRNAVVAGDLRVTGALSAENDLAVRETLDATRLRVGVGSAAQPAIAFAGTVPLGATASSPTGFFVDSNGFAEHVVAGSRALRVQPDGVYVTGAGHRVQAAAFFGDGCNVTNLNARNMTSGVLDVGRGGTGTPFNSANKVLVGDGSSAVQSPAALHWDFRNNRLGILETQPTEALHLGFGASMKAHRALLAGGSVDAPALAFHGAARTGLYWKDDGGSNAFATTTASSSNDKSLRFALDGVDVMSVREGAVAVDGSVTALEFYGDGHNITGLDAANVESGTLNVRRGGTGNSSLSRNKVLVGDGTDPVRLPSKLHWDFANDKLGVGLTSPAEQLHVHGNARAAAFFGDGRHLTHLDMGHATLGVLGVPQGGTATTALDASKVLVGSGTSPVRTPADLHWSFANAALGVGTSNPTTRLDVRGTTKATAFVGDGNAVTNLNVDSVGNGVLNVGFGGTGASNFRVSKLVVADAQRPFSSPDALHWDAANTRLGIGTSAPAHLLHVAGTAYADHFLGDASWLSNLDMNNAGLGQLDVIRGGTGAGSAFGPSKLLVAHGTNPFTSPSTLHWDASNLRLGINIDVPQELLHVAGTAKADAFIGDGNAITNLNMNAAGTGLLDVTHGGTGSNQLVQSKVLVGSGSNPVWSATDLHWAESCDRLGIGTSNPQYKLDVVGDMRTSGTFIGDAGGLTGFNFTKAAGTMIGTLPVVNGGTSRSALTDNKVLVGNGSNPISTYAGFAFDGSNLGVGTSTPAYRLDVNGTANATSFRGNGSNLTALDADHITTGVLPVPHGGTGNSNLTASKLLVGQGAQPVLAEPLLDWDATNNWLSVGKATPTTTLDVGGDAKFNGNVDATGALSVDGDITTSAGNLAVQNGNATVSGYVKAWSFSGNGSNITHLDMNAVSQGILAVPYGGTGGSSHLKDAMIVGNGSSALQSIGAVKWDPQTATLKVNDGLSGRYPTVTDLTNNGLDPTSLYVDWSLHCSRNAHVGSNLQVDQNVKVSHDVDIGGVCSASNYVIGTHLLANGSGFAGAPAFSFLHDSNTGMFTNFGELCFSTNGNARMCITPGSNITIQPPSSNYSGTLLNINGDLKAKNSLTVDKNLGTWTNQYSIGDYIHFHSESQTAVKRNQSTTVNFRSGSLNHGVSDDSVFYLGSKGSSTLTGTWVARGCGNTSKSVDGLLQRIL